MNKKLKLVVMALCCTPAMMAQEVDSLGVQEEQAFTFTEAQLGDDDDMSQNVTIINSNSNAYASQVGYLFSPMRFRYRAFNQKYNDIYINGVQMNDMETGQFRYSLVGGLNQQTRGVENALPFEDNNFAKKIYIETEDEDVYVNVPCADPEAVDFLTIDEKNKDRVFNDTTNIQFSMNINEAEFKYIQNLFNLNKESVRVFIHKNGDDVFISEVESRDENLRAELNETIGRVKNGDEGAFEDFMKCEKMYCKRFNHSDYENFSGEDHYIGCFNKKYFEWVDSDKQYTFEFHLNRVKISSFDEETCVKTSVVLAPVTFA